VNGIVEALGIDENVLVFDGAAQLNRRDSAANVKLDPADRRAGGQCDVEVGECDLSTGELFASDTSGRDNRIATTSIGKKRKKKKANKNKRKEFQISTKKSTKSNDTIDNNTLWPVE
jgi:hypothetical protein